MRTNQVIWRLGLWCVLAGALAGCGEPSRNRVMVITHPAGADVHLNGLLVGKAPVRCRLVDKMPEDRWEHHVIEAKLPGYQTARKEFRYRTGAAWVPERVPLTLQPDLNSVKVETVSLAEATTDKTGPEKKPAEPAPTKATPDAEVKPEAKESPAPVAAKAEPVASAPKARELHKPKTGYAETAPWTRLAPSPSAPAAPTAQIPWTPPADDRRISIELRLLTLDGAKVLRQTSVSGRWGQRNMLVNELVNELLQVISGRPSAALVRLRNRRETPDGKEISAVMTAAVFDAVRRNGSFSKVVRHDLQTLLGGQEEVESIKALQDKSVRKVLAGAKYVILGGVALAEEDTELRQAKERAEEERRRAEDAARVAAEKAEQERKTAEEAARKAAEEAIKAAEDKTKSAEKPIGKPAENEPPAADPEPVAPAVKDDDSSADAGSPPRVVVKDGDAK